MSALMQQIPVPRPPSTRSTTAPQPASDSFFTVTPAHYVTFRTSLNKHCAHTLTIHNNSAETLLYKVKSNEHRVYVVQAACGYIQPHATASVTVLQRAQPRFLPARDVARHRLLVLGAPLSAAPYRNFDDAVSAAVLWLQVRDEHVRQRTLRVVAKRCSLFVPLQQLVMYQPHSLTFSPAQLPHEGCVAQLSVTNISEVRVLYKLKGSNVQAYEVQPRLGVLEPRQTSRIQLRMQATREYDHHDHVHDAQHRHDDDDHDHDHDDDAICATRAPGENDRFRLEVAAVHDENALLNMSAAQLWPRVLAGDIDSVTLHVSKRASDRAFDAPGTVARNFRNLRFTLKPRTPSKQSVQHAACFARLAEDVVVCTPSVLRVRVQDERDEQRSILRVSNICEHSVLLRFFTRNAALYDVQPPQHVIGAYDALTLRVRVRNVRVLCDEWERLTDEAWLQLIVLPPDVALALGAHPGEQPLQQLWRRTHHADVLRVRVALHIRRTL